MHAIPPTPVNPSGHPGCPGEDDLLDEVIRMILAHTSPDAPLDDVEFVTNIIHSLIPEFTAAGLGVRVLDGTLLVGAL